MELNSRTFIFICLAAGLFIYNQIQEKDTKSLNESNILEETSFRQKQAEMINLLCTKWTLFQGDFMRNTNLILDKEQKCSKSNISSQEVIFVQDKTVYIKDRAYQGVHFEDNEGRFTMKQLGYWYLEGDFLFILLKGEGVEEIELVKIFQIKALEPTQLSLTEIRKYANYHEFREKFDQHMETLSQYRREIQDAKQLSYDQKIDRLNQLHREFFNYPK